MQHQDSIHKYKILFQFLDSYNIMFAHTYLLEKLQLIKSYLI